jgi:hypothetical protein
MIEEHIKQQLSSHLSHIENWPEALILYAGSESADDFQILGREFPGTQIRRVELETLLEGDVDSLPGTYDYIHLAQEECRAAADRVFQRLPQVLSLLNDGGIVFASVYGYTGYYGLSMLATIVRKYTADLDLAEKKNLSKVSGAAGIIVSRLPGNHPARRSKEFLELVERGDKQALARLLSISSATVFTVSRLLETVFRSGGRFLGWLSPPLYEPVRFIEDAASSAVLDELPEPRSWEAAEMINAAPPEHSFFIARPGTMSSS